MNNEFFYLNFMVKPKKNPGTPWIRIRTEENRQAGIYMAKLRFACTRELAFSMYLWDYFKADARKIVTLPS
jgi:hypothetical protein